MSLERGNRGRAVAQRGLKVILASAVLALLAASSAAPAGAAPQPTVITPLADTGPPQNYSMDSEPSYTNGTSNLVSWQAGDDPEGSTPIEYYVQVSRQLGFGTIEMNSGWISLNSTTFAGLQDGILYYFRVRARDSLGNTGGYSAPTASTQDDAAPPSPILGSEPAFSSGTSNTLAWGASVDAGVGGVQYYAEASTSSTFATIAANSGWVGGTSNAFSSLVTATTYYFHVKARDGFGQESAWSSVEFSTQDADAPTVPVVSGEPSYTVGTSNAIAWAASTDSGIGGLEYQVDYSGSATFASGVVTSAWQSSTSFTASPLTGGTQYYYRVRARDAFGQTSGNSLIASSTQDNLAPTTPAITAEPAFTNGTFNTVAWSTSVDAGSGGVEYWIDQSRVSTFATLEDSSGWTAATSFLFTKLDDGVTYWYRVKARDGVLLETPFSASASSTQDASPPGTPVLAPEPTYSAGTANAIIWGAASDAGVGGVQYMAEMSSSSTFGTIDQNSGWTASIFAIFSPLVDGTTYYYRVKARDAFGHEGLYSTVTSSTQDNSAPPVPTFVAEPAFTQGLANTLSWGAVADATSGAVMYEVQSATNAAFSAGLVTSGFQSPTSFTFAALVNGQSYFYRVRARDALGFASAFSPSATTTMDNAAPPVPAMAAEPAFTVGTTNALSWGAVVDAGVGGVAYWVESSRVAAFTVIDDSSGWTSATTFTFTRLDDNVRYFYHVKSRDGLAQESAFSASVSSVQDASPPPVPTITPLAAISQGTFQLPIWGAVTDAGSGGVQYFAEASTQPSFATIFANSGFTASTFWIVAGLSDGVTYYYHVKSRDGLLQESVYSTAVFSKQDNAAPSQPAMNAEPAFTAGNSNTVSWSTSLDAGIGGVVYDLQWSNNAAFTGATTVSGISTTSTTVAGLSGGTTYFFHVRARDAFGIATAFSGAVSSTQDNNAPATPLMVAEPGYTAGTTNQVSWGAVADAGVGGVLYDVQASRSATFAVIEADSAFIAATSYAFTRLDDGVQFYYRVAAKNALDFLSAFSGTVTSTQDNSPPTVPVLAAEPTFTAGTTNTVTWGASVDAGVGNVTYQLQYSDTPTFVGGATVLVSPASSPATAAGLANAVTYYFHVRALDAFGFTSAWSNVEYSTQDNAGPPVPTMTAEPSFTQGTSNLVAWSAVTDAGIGGVQYWVEYASSAAFTVILGNSGWISGTSNTFFALTDGTRYFFHAKARDAFAQESGFSASVNAQQDNSAPTTPVPATPSAYTMGNVFTFTWAASSDTGAGGIEYEAQYAASGGFSPVLGTSGWVSATTFTFAGLADGTLYSFRVRARDSLGNTGGFSLTRNTTMDASPPSVPLQFSQTPFTPGTSNTVGWAASSDAGVGGIQYQVQYSLVPTFPGFGTVTSAFGVTSPYTVNGLIDGFTYYYRIRARDSFLQTSGWSAVEQSTQDNSPPAVPVANGLPPFTDGPSTFFSWNPAADAGVGAVQYQSQVARDPAFTVVVSTSGWGPENAHVFSGLTDATTFYYRVRARDAFQFTSNWSSANASMTDFLPPPVPALSSLPAYSRGLSALLVWPPVADAGVGGVAYEVQAFTSTDTSKPFVATPWTGAFQQLVGGLPEGTLVYFAARARDAMGHASSLSALVSTRPDNSPPPVPALSAMPAYTSGLVLTARWGNVTDAGVGGVLFRAQVSLDPSFSSSVYDSGWVTGLSYTPLPLASGVQYFARVKAADAFLFESPWSPTERTTMDNDAPGQSVLQPLSSFTAGSTVTLGWQAVVDAGVDAVSYDAQASTAADFSVISKESGWVSGATSWTFTGLADGTKYYFRLLGHDSFLHNATPSAPVSTTMDASAPPTPELSLMAAYTAGLQQAVGWNTVIDLGVGGVEYLVESATNSTFAGGAVSSGWLTAFQYTFAGLADGGRYFYRVHARDSFGHMSNWSVVRNATMDDSAPAVVLNQTTVITDASAVSITGTATDAVSGVFSVMYSEDGGATWLAATGTKSFTAPASGLAEGKTTVLVKALDVVGHSSPIAKVEVTVDTGAPIVTFQSPGNGSLITGLVGVFAVIADPNFDSFRLQTRPVGVGNFTDIVANGSMARGDNFLGLWDTRVLDNGLFDLRLTARDVLGHVTQRTIQVRLLNSDLSVTYGDLTVSDRQPLRGEIVNVTAVVTNYGTAPADAVTVRLKDNGATVFEKSGISIDAHAAYSVDVPYNLSTPGAHAFTLEVSYPEGGNDTGLSTAAAVVASEPPVPEPKPFLVEFAGFFSVIALVALAAIAAWAFVQINRLKRGGGGAVYGAAVPEEGVGIEWESDEFM